MSIEELGHVEIVELHLFASQSSSTAVWALLYRFHVLKELFRRHGNFGFLARGFDSTLVGLLRSLRLCNNTRASCRRSLSSKSASPAPNSASRMHFMHFPGKAGGKTR